VHDSDPLEDRIRTLQEELRDLKSQRPSWATKVKQVVAPRWDAFSKKVTDTGRKVWEGRDMVVIYGFLWGVCGLVAPPVMAYDAVRKHVVPRIPLVNKKTRGSIVAEQISQVHFNSFCYSGGEYRPPNAEHIALCADVQRQYLREAKQVVRLCDRSLKLLRTTDYRWTAGIESRRDDAHRFITEYGPVIEKVA
jgi:hypothetical protein|tara:strand:- start:32 stop:610 length:579 start_codon:yes stop_codon:yes gene_type:complete